MLPKILWIDDDTHFLNGFASMLNKHGYKVEFAESALDGFRKMATEKYVLVIIDLILPISYQPEPIPEVVNDWGQEIYPGIGIAKWASRNLHRCPIIICSVIRDPIGRFNLQEYKIESAYLKTEFSNALESEILEIIKRRETH